MRRCKRRSEVFAAGSRTAGDVVAARGGNDAMDVPVRIPDEIAVTPSAAGGNLSRRAREALALEEDCGGWLSKAELRSLPGFETRYKLDRVLKAHGESAASRFTPLPKV